MCLNDLKYTEDEMKQYLAIYADRTGKNIEVKPLEKKKRILNITAEEREKRSMRMKKMLESRKKKY